MKRIRATTAQEAPPEHMNCVKAYLNRGHGTDVRPVRRHECMANKANI